MDQWTLFSRERRRYPRRNWQKDLTAAWMPDEKTEDMVTLHTEDISSGGMGVFCHREIPMGKTICCGLPQPGGGRRYVLARVVQVHSDCGQTRLGLSFDGASLGNWKPMAAPVQMAA